MRCHAVLCKSDLTAQTIASQLDDRLTVALDEFMREKRRSQNSRLTVKLHRLSSLPNDISNHGGGSVRTKFLKLGQNFRPPIGHSNSAPKLGSITEGDEDDEVMTADSAADDVHNSTVTDSDRECDGDSVFSSSPHSQYVITGYHYRHDSAQGSPAGIVFTHVRIFRFFAPQRLHVAGVPAKFHLDQLRGVICSAPKL